MLDLKVVFHRGNALSVRQVVMEEMGLRNGQDVTEEQMWQCIELNLNAAALVGELRARREKGEENIPDPSALDQQLEKIRNRL